MAHHRPSLALVTAVALASTPASAFGQEPAVGAAPGAGAAGADGTIAARLGMPHAAPVSSAAEPGLGPAIGLAGAPAPLAPTALNATLASAVVPGSGQWLTGSRRGFAYAVVELGGWLLFLDRRGEGRALERDYRDLAWSVARTGTGTPRRDGDFEYYEAMASYETSGAFDRDPVRPGIQPETDETTYNGTIWALARAMHLPAGADTAAPDSPEYDAALAYYRQNAVPADMTWTWDGRTDAQRTFVDLIDRSDAALRDAGRALGLILANHVISAVDALISARLLGRGDAAPELDLGARRDRAGELRWSAAVRIPLTRTH